MEAVNTDKQTGVGAFDQLHKDLFAFAFVPKGATPADQEFSAEDTGINTGWTINQGSRRLHVTPVHGTTVSIHPDNPSPLEIEITYTNKAQSRTLQLISGELYDEYLEILEPEDAQNMASLILDITTTG